MRARSMLSGLAAAAVATAVMVGPEGAGATPPSSFRVDSSSRGAVRIDAAAPVTDGYDPGVVTATPTAPPPIGAAVPGGPPAAGARSVIGLDGRSQVVDTIRYPSSAIGRLSYVQNGRSSFCTAFLVDADTVMTAGHCVHAGGTGPDEGWSSNFIFTPAQHGVTGDAAPLGSCRGVEAMTTRNWSRTGREASDLGWVHLDCSIGDTAGWLAVGSPTRKALVGRPIHVRGYPARKPPGTMWTDRDRVVASTRAVHFYRADTHGGQSGSPAFHWRGCPGGERGVCVAAVHAYGTHGSGRHHAANHGLRATPYRSALTAAVAAGGHGEG